MLIPDTPVADAVQAPSAGASVDLSAIGIRALARSNVMRIAMLIGVLTLGAAVRLNVLRWDAPFTPHHPDEAILPLESIAMWEGITPREVGWPASTTRMLLSATYATEWAAEQARHPGEFGDPARAMDDVASWIAAHYVDSSSLFRTARWLMVAIGTLQLVALVWALRQWSGWTGTLLATLGAAIAPLAVSHSQYVLADMTGVLFATLIVGVAGRPATMSTTLTMAVLAALGASSKLHFGIWLLVPACAVWFAAIPTSSKVRLTLATLAAFAAVFTALVPWLWLNPLLFAKEFAGVVVVKVVSGAGSTLVGPVLNAWTIVRGLGALTLVGASVGLVAALRGGDRRLLPIGLTTGVAVAALAVSAIVFDRYGLVVMPGLSLLAAIGWEAGFSARSRQVRGVMTAALLIAFVATSGALVRSQTIAAETDVSVLATDWIVANIRPGARVARHDEENTYLPRTRDQLDSCIDGISSRRAYSEKLQVIGMPDRLAASEPMRGAVLNDELFQAYWCRRERASAADTGFTLIPYHREARFGSMREEDAIDGFRARLNDASTAGPDVLVTSRPVDTGIAPAATFRTSRGERIIYARPEVRR